jgi:type I restriction enzyme S subunit
MELRPGYKQTEVGAIPEDWDVVLLDSVSRRASGHTPDKAHPEYWGGDIKWVSLADSHRLDDLYIDETTATITAKGIANSSANILPAGCCIVSRDAGVGKSAVLAEKMAVSQHFMAWYCGPSLNNHYLYFLLQAMKPELERIAIGNTIKTIGLPYFKSLRVPLPSVVEQQSIASTLLDVDQLIRELAACIAKKRNIKQAAMQELLTGKRRLPGFEGEWEVKKLGDSALLKARIGWQGLTTGEYLSSGNYFLVTGTEFESGYIAWNECHFVDEKRYKQDKYIQLRPRDILVTKDGTIGKVALVTGLPGPATLNSGIFVIRPLDNAFSPEFFYYLLCSQVFSGFLGQLAAGSTINHLYQKDFVSFLYRIPPTIEEQAAIANILNDIDSELIALKIRLNKTRAIKQGMMQELLTGKIRLT